MTQYILVNDVSLSQNGQTSHMQAGKLIDSTNQNVSVIRAAGGVLWPASDPGMVAADLITLASATGGKAAPPAFINGVAITNQASPAVFNGLVVAGIPYTPTSSGICEFGFQWSSAGASAVDNPAAEVYLYVGGALSGGTVANGIRYPLGSTIAIAGGTFSAVLANAQGGQSGPTPSFPAGCIARGIVQLIPGIAYTLLQVVVGWVTGVNYTAMTVSSMMREIR